MSPARVVPIVLAASVLAASSAVAAPDAKHIREQLALAVEDKDALAQIELLRRLLDVEPGDMAAHRALIALWLRIRDYDMAESALNAWSTAPADVAALTRAEVLRRRDNDLKGAIRTLDSYLAHNPKDLAAWEALVDCLIAAKDNAELVKALNSYLALDASGLNFLRRADAKAALGDFAGALADAKTAQKNDPDSSDVKNALPRYERLEEALQAIPALDAALAKNPQDVNALLDRAWWWRYGGMNARSLADAEAATKIAPQSDLALIAKYRALYLLDRIPSWQARDEAKVDVTSSHALETGQAILAADLALARNPEAAEQLAKRAFALNEARQFLLAREDVDKALALDPKNAAAALEGIFTLSAQNGEAAPYLRKLEESGASKHQLALGYGYLADMYFRLSNFALALDFADQSLAAEESERLLRVKAATLQRLDRSAEAATALKRADALKKKSE